MEITLVVRLGGFGVDFAFDTESVQKAVQTVAKGVLGHGVTSFCPTLVSSMPDVYDKVLPYLRKQPGSKEGAEVLGAHVEGPFINQEKKGAHDPATMQSFDNGMNSIREVYKHLDAVCIITLAPELPNAVNVCRELTDAGIIVSVGTSNSGNSVCRIQNTSKFQRECNKLFLQVIPWLA